MTNPAQAHATPGQYPRDALTEDAELDRRILANRQRVLTELAQEEALSAKAREKALS